MHIFLSFENEFILFGLLANALCNILRYAGMGSVLKWVDDFVFAQVKAINLAVYNKGRVESRVRIKKRNHGKVCAVRCHGCMWFEGQTCNNRSANEFVKDFCLPLQDLVGN
jgi:hypothetical protein